MLIVQMCLSIPTPSLNLSSSRVLSGRNQLFLTSKFSRLSIDTTSKMTPIRMGGGPRTFPGGVSKWQWKRMQAKKSKQLLKARLARERQIYEMRKRAELKAAVSELERPWEVVERAPKLFSVGADEQVKVLADRFQRPGGFDMWSEKDGPQLFTPVDGVPTARFFPKGVVHSIQPYGKIKKDLDGTENLSFPGLVSEPDNGMETHGHPNSGRFRERNGYMNSGRFRERNGYMNSRRLKDESSSGGHQIETKNSVESSVDRNGKDPDGKFMKKGKRRSFGVENSNNLNGLVSGRVGFDKAQRRQTLDRRNVDNGFRRGSRSQKLRGPNSEVYDMSLQYDGSYGIQAENWECDSNIGAKSSVKPESF